MSKPWQGRFNLFILISLTTSLIIYYLRLSPNLANYLLILIGIFATIPVIISAGFALKNKKVTVDLLASIALFVSLLHHEWASVAFINLMITCARIFGDYTQNRADNAIKSLLKLRPERVKIKNGKEIKTIDIKKVQAGDIVVIEAGDRIPVDGTIIEGEGSIDQSSLTGESLPVERKINQKVFSSTLNLSGSFLIKTQKIGKDTTFEKIVALIQNAQDEKQGIQGIAEKFSTVYIVVTLSATIILFALTQNLNLILSVLLVACADDIAVAIPMAYWGTIAKAAKNGIIIKGSEYLDGLANLETVIFDKTGTLTKGEIKTQNLMCFNKYDTGEALKLFGQIESVSEHPIAKAIALHAKQDGIKIETPQEFEEFAGLGIKAKIENKKVVAGNIKFMQKEKVKITKEELKIAQNNQEEGLQVVYLGIEEKLAAIITLTDQIRPEVRPTISSLKNLGVKNIIMLTGDNEPVASRVAKEIGIEEFHANLLPQDKLDFIKNLIGKSKGKIAMVGDGVNDAASLKLADVGVAMGAIGADTSIEAADVALMQDNLTKLPVAIKMGQYVREIAKQNFIIWGVVNLAGLFLVFTSLIGPQGAAAWNFITDFFPIANSLKVLKNKFT